MPYKFPGHFWVKKSTINKLKEFKDEHNIYGDDLTWDKFMLLLLELAKNNVD